MRIDNTRFGTIEVSEDQLIDFPHGMIGLPEARQFVVLEHGDGSPLRWLQSTARPELAFVIIDPLPLVPGFPRDRIVEAGADLGLARDEEVAIAAVVTVPPRPAQPTVNLMAPLVMGVSSRKGMQVVLHDGQYHTRHPLVFGEPDHPERCGRPDPQPSQQAGTIG